jgi:hypothetical protein
MTGGTPWFPFGQCAVLGFCGFLGATPHSLHKRPAPSLPGSAACSGLVLAVGAPTINTGGNDSSPLMQVRMEPVFCG